VQKNNPGLSQTVSYPLLLRPLWHISLLFCGILGPVIFFVVYFIFGSISPDFDMLRQPIGRLELLHYGWIQSLNFIVYGLFTVAFALGLRAELQSGLGVTLLPLLHVFIAASMILLGLFIHEPVHTYISIFSTVTIVAGFWLFARRFAGNPQWKHWDTCTNLCGFMVMLFSFLYWYTCNTGSHYAGLFEHAIVATRTIWLGTFILKLIGGSTLAPCKQQ
jgi:hypothetical protein